MAERFEAIVIGGGPAGLAAGILLARAGLNTVLLRKGEVAPPGAEARTTALLAGSVSLLEHLGVWPALAASAAPLRAMRLIDDTARLLRAPTVTFRAEELGLDAFGHNIPNDVLVRVLDEAARATVGLAIRRTAATAVVANPDSASVGVEDGPPLEARLIVAADGRRSMARQAVGIATTEWRYDQVAVTLNLDHAAPHRGISTEFHTPSGPFTLVPLPGNRSSLVAVCRPADAEYLMSLADELLAAELERRAHSLLGAFALASTRAAWPLEGAMPRSFAKDRIALVGEAAHVLPPIGAQGLNLGLRDAATIAELADDAHARGADPGGAEVIGSYDRARRADVWTRTAIVDALNRSLLSPLLPLSALRGLGLFLADRIGPLRRALLAAGVQPRAVPRFMRAPAR